MGQGFGHIGLHDAPPLGKQDRRCPKEEAGHVGVGDQAKADRLGLVLHRDIGMVHVALQKAHRSVRKGKARPAHGPVLIGLVILPRAVMQPVASKVDPLGPLDVELAPAAKVARQDGRTGPGRRAC